MMQFHITEENNVITGDLCNYPQRSGIIHTIEEIGEQLDDVLKSFTFVNSEIEKIYVYLYPVKYTIAIHRGYDLLGIPGGSDKRKIMFTVTKRKQLKRFKMNYEKSDSQRTDIKQNK